VIRQQRTSLLSFVVATWVIFAPTTPVAGAIVSFPMPFTPEYTTVPQSPPGVGQFANNGIWLTMTNGNPLIVSNNSFPGFSDGQYQLRTVSFAPPAGEALVQGFFANGNDVVVQGSGGFPDNPAYIPFGGTVGPSSSFIGGASFTALSGSFGNWISPTPLRGALGVKFPISGQTHYGFIDITQQPDGTITLNGYAYNDVPNESITTAAVPEPSAIGLAAAGLLASSLAARHFRRRRPLREENCAHRA
jgi:hypothetical protein